MSVSLPVSLWTRLDALSAAHGVARGTIAREAIDAGLRAVAERLRRAARRDAREAGRPQSVQQFAHGDGNADGFQVPVLRANHQEAAAH